MDKKAVLSQGEPRDAFWDHRKADDGLHIPYNNAGLIFKVSEEIAAENVSSIIFFDYIDNFVYFFSPCFFLILSLITKLIVATYVGYLGLYYLLLKTC